MIKTSLVNYATRNVYRKTIDACWHEKITCTPKSTSKKIQSDVTASTYEFLLTSDTTNLLQALKVAKSTNLKFTKNTISGDEFTEVPELNASLRILIKFSDDKKNITVKCYIKQPKKKQYSITRENIPHNAIFLPLYDKILEIEDDYSKL